jgi:hypothetical protein
MCLVYNVVSVSLLCLVWPMFSVSPDCLSSSCVLYTMWWVSLDCLSSYCVLYNQCSPFLWIVCLRPVSCVTNVLCVPGLFCLHPVSCVNNVVNFSGLFVFVLCLVWPMFPVSLDCLFSYCVLCDQCSPCVWIVCLRTVSCVTNVPRVSRLFVFVLCLVWPMFPVSLDCLFSYCVLCDQCSPCLWIVLVLCPVWPMLSVSLDCLSPVSCMANVACVSGLS